MKFPNVCPPNPVIPVLAIIPVILQFEPAFHVAAGIVPPSTACS